ncbi:hypothetical protein [Streptomyces sp. URMC 129]|uniref:hypothetical protein n=1 Tax=Streptomyces sp. URMC 129 TaxID=3423407 RepID=UPI003F19C3AC
MLVVVLCAGCSGMAGEPPELDYTPSVKSVDDARVEARELSSHLLDMTGIQGWVSEPGPGVSTCPADPDKERLYRMRHPWSIAEVSDATLEEGMANLRQGLLDEGWELVVEEEINDAYNSPRLLFESKSVEYAVDITLAVGGSDRSRLDITTVSACFSTPDGESPSGEF